MRLVFQIDKIESLKPKTDSSLLVMRGALRRGWEVWFYHPSTLRYETGSIFAEGYKFGGEQRAEGAAQTLELDSFDFVFLRQDPPFNMEYITTTYLLERLKKARVLNDPRSVRDCPEKLFILNFPEFMPKTLISSSEIEVRRFWEEQGEVVIKPLYAHAGMGVFYIPKDDKNLFNAFRTLAQLYPGVPLIAQQYIKNVTKGDKRILLVDGEFAGALNRVQAEHYAISNTAVGGKYFQTELTEREAEICQRLKPELKKRGLFLVGLDVIDGLVTEINVTSPTGFCLVNELYGIKTEDLVLDKLESL